MSNTIKPAYIHEIKSCNFTAAIEKIKELLDSGSNDFIFSVVLNDDEVDAQTIKKALTEKFPNNKEFLLRVENSNDGKVNFYMRKEDECTKKIFIDPCVKEGLDNPESLSVVAVDTEILLNILQDLTEENIRKLSAYPNLVALAMKSSDHFCLKLLKLFLPDEDFTVYEGAPSDNSEAHGDQNESKAYKIDLSRYETLNESLSNVANCIKFYCDESDIREVEIDIIGMLQKINLKSLMDYASIKAKKNKLEIFIDYKHKAVNWMYPKVSKSTLGYTPFNENKIYLGRCENQNQRSAALAHELFHYICFQMYQNEGVPYKNPPAKNLQTEDVRNRIEDYKNVIRDAGKKSKINAIPELIIDSVIAGDEGLYDYTKKELLARVPHLLVYYSNSPRRFEKLKNEYKMLFEYYQKYFCKDLDCELEKLKQEG